MESSRDFSDVRKACLSSLVMLSSPGEDRSNEGDCDSVRNVSDAGDESKGLSKRDGGIT